MKIIRSLRKPNLNRKIQGMEFVSSGKQWNEGKYNSSLHMCIRQKKKGDE